MKTKLLLGIISVAILFMLYSSPAQARNDVLTLPLEDILQSAKAEKALLDIPVYFAGQDTPVISHRREVTVSRKTNAFNKTDVEACQWVLLSAMKALQDSAIKGGYDAVANMKSNYEHNEFASSKEFQCGAGTFIAGVALKAELVRFNK